MENGILTKPLLEKADNFLQLALDFVVIVLKSLSGVVGVIEFDLEDVCALANSVFPSLMLSGDLRNAITGLSMMIARLLSCSVLTLISASLLVSLARLRALRGWCVLIIREQHRMGLWEWLRVRFAACGIRVERGMDLHCEATLTFKRANCGAAPVAPLSPLLEGVTESPCVEPTFLVPPASEEFFEFPQCHAKDGAHKYRKLQCRSSLQSAFGYFKHAFYDFYLAKKKHEIKHVYRPLWIAKAGTCAA
jgi:hypothetical protein